MKKQYGRPARRLEPGLQDVHREAVDVGDHAVSDADRDRAVAVGRQFRVFYAGGGCRRLSLSQDEPAGRECRGRSEKAAPRKISGWAMLLIREIPSSVSRHVDLLVNAVRTILRVSMRYCSSTAAPRRSR